MPTFQESLSRRPAARSTTAPAAPVSPVTTVIPEVSSGMNAFMHCSMPVSASTYDSLARQFYGNSRVPQTRILPVGK